MLYQADGTSPYVNGVGILPSRMKVYGLIDPEILRLRETHDLWKLFNPQWAFYLSAYEGGQSFTTAENLFKHQRENSADYDDRVQRLHYFNYCAPLVDFFTNFIFSETIHRDGGSDQKFYEDFSKNVNMKGDDIVTFMRTVCEDMQIFGMAYVLIDAPQVNLPDGLIVTKYVEQQLNLRPYWCLLKPDEIIDWETDEFGNYMYMKRLQNLTQRFAGRKVLLQKYSEFYPNETVITYVDVTDPQKPKIFGSPVTYPNSLGEIPILSIRYKRNKMYPDMATSFLVDLAYNNREVMNQTSLLQEFLYRQAFNILAKEVDTQIPMQSQEEGVAGTANVLEYPKGANPPNYLSPASDPAQEIRAERLFIVSEMYKRAAQDVMSELFNGEGASGFSKAQGFAKTVPFITSRADNLEQFENKLTQKTWQFQGKDWNGSVKYKDRYEVTNLNDYMTQLTMLFKDLKFPSETFAKEELKRAVAEFDGKISPENRMKIEAEIEKMNFKEWIISLEPPKAVATSPAAQQKNKQTGTMSEVSRESKVGVQSSKKVV